ncbi:MAG TPA: hypothetical protein VIN75_12785 [Burkholderiaceae bacterium]
MRLRFLLLPLLLAACSHKPPATDWTPAHWGMMPSEVMNSVPDSAPESGGKLVTGATARVRLESAAVAGATLPAEFYFLDDRLVQVMFSDSQYHDNADSRKTLEHLAAQLRRQYGQETLGKAMDPAAGLSYDASWTAGDTEIILSASPVSASTSMVTVIYRRKGSMSA